MKTQWNTPGQRRRAPHGADSGDQDSGSRRRGLASIVRPDISLRDLLRSLAVHGVIVAITAVVVIIRPHTPWAVRPVLDDPLPTELSARVSGGSSSPLAGPSVRSFHPRDRMTLSLRHNGEFHGGGLVLARVERLSAGTASDPSNPEVYVVLDPHHVSREGQRIRYEGELGQVLPLADGLWRLSVMLRDPVRCETQPLHSCIEADAWLHIQRV